MLHEARMVLPERSLSAILARTKNWQEGTLEEIFRTHCVGTTSTLFTSPLSISARLTVGKKHKILGNNGNFFPPHFSPALIFPLLILGVLFSSTNLSPRQWGITGTMRSVLHSLHFTGGFYEVSSERLFGPGL